MKKNRFSLFLKTLLFIGIINSFSLNLYSQDLKISDWPHLKGYWKFQQASNLTKATVGNNLILKGTQTAVNGPDYGDTAVRIGFGSYYKSFHGMSPNGGGDSVNQYTLMFDFKVLSLKNWHTFHQTDTTNASDGECFIKPTGQTTAGTIGVGYTGYSATAIVPNKWYRLVISVNLGHYYNYYLNGNLIHQGDTDEIFIDKRFALTPAILFFADNNQEDDTIDIASIAIFDTCFTSAMVAKAGTIDPCVLRPPVVNLNQDTSFCQGGFTTLTAPSGYTKYFWSGVSGNQTLKVTQSKTVVLEVEDSRGCKSQPDTNVIVVYPYPKASLAADTSFCQGESKQLDAGSGFISYQWSDNNSNQKRTVNTSVNLWVKVQEGSYNCWSLPDSINIVVNPLPVVSLGNDTSLCDGASLVLDAGNGYTSYNWSNSTNTQKQTIFSSIIVSVFVKDKNGCLSNADTISIIFNKLPFIYFGNDTSICKKDSVVLDAGTGYGTYYWSNGFKGSKQAIYQTTLITARVKDAITGCWSKDEKIAINVNDLPIKSLGSDDSFCEGESLILDVGSYFTNYKWSNGFIGKMLLVDKTDTISLIVQDPVTACWSEPDTIILTMLPSPKINLGADLSLCDGDSAIVSAGSSFKAYQWSDAKTDISRIIKTTKTLWLIVTGANNCKSKPDTIKIVFHALPEIILSMDSSICKGEKIVVDAGANYNEYHWSDSFSKQIREITESTNVKIYVIDSNTCKSNEETIIVTVRPLPQPDLGNDLVKTLYDTINLSPGSNYSSYFWSDGSKDSVLQLIASKIDTGNFVYWVMVTDSFGCSNSDTVKVKIYNSLSSEFVVLYEIKIHPNPSDGFFTIDLAIQMINNPEITVYDRSFKKLINRKFTGNIENILLDLHEYPDGFYFVKIQTNGYSVIRKLIKS